jgi:peptidoglycan/xylan/chitin deacetylase (PgdA/CDA1 family)
MTMVLGTLNRLAHGLVGATGSARLMILIFHRVHARTDPLAPSEPDACRFDSLLGLLRRSFRVLPLRHAVQALAQGRLPSRALAITFDDGYADNAEVALPLLRKHGLVATFYVSTGFLDDAPCMWNDVIIEAVRAASVRGADFPEIGARVVAFDNIQARQQAIELLINHAKYLPPSERASFVEQLPRRLGVGTALPTLMMRSSQVRELHAAGMEIGAHTVDHPILTSLDIDGARRQISQGRDRLAEIIDAPIETFAYPNGKPGRDYAAAHVALVRELGFMAAVSTAPGVADRQSDQLQLPRYTPWARGSAMWSIRLLNNRLQRGSATV